MSSSRDPERRRAKLICSAPPGVTVTVLDGRFRSVGEGIGTTTFELPDGVYTVRFLAGGRMEEHSVRLLGIDRPLEVTSSTLIPAGSVPDVSRAVSTAETSAQPSSPDWAEVMVFLKLPLEAKLDTKSTIRLFDGDEAMRSKGFGDLDGQDVLDRDEYGWAARRYRVRAGVYRLKYLANDQRMLEQSVYAFAGRRTFVLFRYGEAILLSRDGKRHVRQTVGGIDPSRTMIVSAGCRDVSTEPEELRIAEVLLHDLVQPATRLDRSMIEGLAADSACPLLRLYAAALLLRRSEIRSSRLGKSTDTAPSEESDLSAVWLHATASQLLWSTPQDLDLPDRRAMQWHLSSIPGQPPAAVSTLEKPLEQAPMLDCVWRWAIARSVDNPRLLGDAESLWKASESWVRSGPWLVWETEAKQPVSRAVPSSFELNTSIRELWTELNNRAPAITNPLSAEDSLLGASDASYDLLNRLSPPAQQTVQAVASIRMAGVDDSNVKTIASTLGTTTSTLFTHLNGALKELKNLA